MSKNFKISKKQKKKTNREETAKPKKQKKKKRPETALADETAKTQRKLALNCVGPNTPTIATTNCLTHMIT
jgi:hypothetical protein